MPANLPPDYYAAESAFRGATTPQDKLDALERMLAVMPHHKGTDHLRAELRSRQAKLSQEVGRQRAHAHTDPYAVRREGAGQAALVGMPNAGKSSLLHALTGAAAKLADYPFTTQLPQPAMMAFEDIQVQLIDLPAVAPAATPAWLRGLVPHADLLLLLVDLDADPTADLPAAADGAELLQLELADRLPLLPTSAVSGAGLDELRRRIVQALDVVRVYAKPPGRPPDLDRPFVLRPRAVSPTSTSWSIGT